MNSNGDSGRFYGGVCQKEAPTVTFSSEPVSGVYMDTPGASSGWAVSKRSKKRLRVDDSKTTFYTTTETPILEMADTGSTFTGVVNIPGATGITGPLRLADGAASAPAYSFTNSSDTGMYYVGGSGPRIARSGVDFISCLPGNLYSGTNNIASDADVSGSTLTSLSTVHGTIQSASAPTFAWGGHVTSGLYWDTTQLAPAMSSHSIKNMVWDDDKTSAFMPIREEDGKASTPSYAFTNGTGSGLFYEPTGSTPTMSTGGTTTMRWAPGTTFSDQLLQAGTNSVSGGPFSCTSLTSSGTISTSSTVSAATLAISGTSGMVGTTTLGASSAIGSVGMNKLQLQGTTTSTSGPHIQAFTSADNFPVFQGMNWAHDNVALFFDGYYDGVTFKSAHSGSNYRIYKNSNVLAFAVASAVAQGSSVTFVNALSLDTALNTTLGGNLVVPISKGITLKAASAATGTGNGAFNTNVVLVAGTATITNSFVTALCVGVASLITAGGTPGTGCIITCGAGTYTITSNNPLDTSTYNVAFFKSN